MNILLWLCGAAHTKWRQIRSWRRLDRHRVNQIFIPFPIFSALPTNSFLGGNSVFKSWSAINWAKHHTPFKQPWYLESALIPCFLPYITENNELLATRFYKLFKALTDFLAIDLTNFKGELTGALWHLVKEAIPFKPSLIWSIFLNEDPVNSKSKSPHTPWAIWCTRLQWNEFPWESCVALTKLCLTMSGDMFF